MKCRILLVVAVLAFTANFSLAVGPHERSKPSRNTGSRQPSSRQQLNPGSSPSLSARMSNSDRSAALRRAQSGNRTSMLPGNNDRRDLDRRNRTDVRTRDRVDVDRTNVNVDRRNVNINRPNINVNRTNINRSTVVSNRENNLINNSLISNRVNNTNIVNNNNTTIVNNNYGNQRINNNSNNNRRNRSYYNSLHTQWRPSGWNSYRPAYGNFYGYQSSSSVVAVGGLQVGYVNPFYVQPTTVVAGLDYSQPIHVPAPDYRESNDELVRSEQAIRRFDDAREFFRRGDYARASDLVDEAIQLLPSDPTLHQFRALVLFALGQYPDAAAAAYSVLAVDSGWTRDTLSKLYDDPKQYEEQFRALQRFADANPRATDARFLLAYHYLMLGEMQSAAQNLEVVRDARPDDRLTESMLSQLREAS